MFVRGLMKRLSPYFLLILGLCALSCKDDETSTAQKEEEIITEYLDSAGLADVAQQDESGLYYYSITLNSDGKTQSDGKVLSIFYKLQVLGGQMLDELDSLDGDTLVVKQGADAIYPVGLDLALDYMKEGETWGFILPSDLAYGNYSYSTLLPANSVILAEITLLEIRSEDDVLTEELKRINQYVYDNGLDSAVTLSDGMRFMVVSSGSGSSPQTGDEISIAYKLTDLDKNVLDQASSSDPFTYDYNEGTVISGLDAGVGRMITGEEALLIIPSSLGYGESAQVIPDYLTDDMIDLDIVPAYAAKVGPYVPLVFDVTLESIN